MAMTVNWRWSMPQVADPNAQANNNQQGFLGLAEGIGNMIGNARKERRDEEIRRQAQQNWLDTFNQNKANAAQQQASWDRQFAQNQANAALQQQNWLKQFEQNAKIQDAALERQRAQDQKLQEFYDRFFGNEDDWQRLQQLRATYGSNGLGINPANALVFGLDPYLPR